MRGIINSNKRGIQNICEKLELARLKIVSICSTQRELALRENYLYTLGLQHTKNKSSKVLKYVKYDE